MKPDIKALQIQLTGFLDKDTPSFCKELWKLFLSAQASPQGVPQELLEAKKLELIQEKVSPPSSAACSTIFLPTDLVRNRSWPNKPPKRPAFDATSSSAATVGGDGVVA